MAAKNGNPFAAYDMTKMFAGFDPAKVADDFSKFANTMKVPTVDMDAMVTAGRKNFEALTVANQVAVQAVQAVATHQAAFAQKTMDEATKVVETFGAAKTPQDVAAKQVEVAKSTYEDALANAQEVSELVAKSQAEAFAAINARVTEQFEEIKAATLSAAK